ncbi:hypothetical protein ABVK25_002528 [Lepraria finkii]|uniref:Uncharacterized protein n=1 Tax=Lepraria finkii TaxID=1340010 RepID=A0ABR4BIB6_9LECA
MGLFKSLGQLLGGVAALVGQKAIIHSRTCDTSLTKAFHHAQLFSTAVTCTGKQPLVIMNNESIIPSFDAFNTSSHFNFTTYDEAESIVFDYPHNFTNTTVLPHAGYLPLLASATEVGWTTFAEFYLEPACYTLLMKILLPLLLRIWRVVTPAKVYHEKILPFMLGVRRFFFAVKFYLEIAYRWCALLIEVLLPFFLAAWRLITAPKPDKSPRPNSNIPPIPSLPNEEITQLRLTTKSQATEIEQLKAQIAADKANKQKKIDDEASTRVKQLEKKLKDWEGVLAKEKSEAGRSMESQKKYYLDELAELKERCRNDRKLTAKRNETIVADLKQRIDALQAQVDGQGTQLEPNPQAKTHESVAVECEEGKEVVAVAVQKKQEEWESWYDAERTKAEKKLKDLQEQLANATEKSNSEKNRADQAESQFNNAQQILKEEWYSWVDAERTKAEEKVQDLQGQLANATEKSNSEKNRADQAESQFNNARQIVNAEWNSWVDAERTKAEEKVQDLQGQLANATEKSNSEKNRADQAESQFNNAQQIVNNEKKRAEDAEQQLQIAQRSANQAGTKAQNAEIQLQNYQKHADEIWTTARKEAQKTAEDHAKNTEGSLKQLQDHGTYSGTSSASPRPSATLSDPMQATGPTDTLPKPSTAPLYNPMFPPTFGGGAAGITQIIPTNSSIPTTSISDLARYFTDKYNMPGPYGTSLPSIPGLSPKSKSTNPSGLPGPSNSSPPSIPGFNFPVSTPINPTALTGTWPVPSPFNPVIRAGKGPVPNPFNPNTNPFKPDAPSTHIPTVGIPEVNAMDTSCSSSARPSDDDDDDDDAMSDNGLNDLSNFSTPNASPFKPDATPSRIPTVGIPDGNAMDTSSSLSSAPHKDAMSDNGLNDLSNFSNPNDNAVARNKASADVMAGRKIAKPRGRRPPHPHF